MKIPYPLWLLQVVPNKLSNSEKWQRFGFSLLASLIILSFVKIPIERFKIDAEEGLLYNHSKSFLFMADDLDTDGNSERILYLNDQYSDRFTLMIYDIKGLIIETINFIGHEWSKDLIPAIFDLNDDGIKELLFITVKNDSVFLNAINSSSLKNVIHDLYLGSIERPMPQMAYRSEFFCFEDYDSDGNNELYFHFDAGYGLSPRGIYRLDVQSMVVYKTPDAYIVWGKPIYFKDINRDGKKEILAGSYSPMNVPQKAAFSDDRPWIGVFDLELNYLFPPIPKDVGYGLVELMPASFADTLFYGLFVSNSTLMDSCSIFIMDYNGNIIREKQILRDDPSTQREHLKTVGTKNYLTITRKGKYELTENLDKIPHQVEKIQNDPHTYLYEKSWDIDADNDGNPESIVYNTSSLSFEIFNHHKNYVSKHPTINQQVIKSVQPFLYNGKVEKLLVSTDSGYFFLTYQENPSYWMKYVIWITIFFATYILVYLIQYFQRRRLEAKWATEKQLAELQYNTIRNQLNPHFIFNALSSLGYLIETGKKDEAYDFLTVNTRLIRKVLEDAELTTRSLSDEIHFVRDYLSVQEVRFKHRFKVNYFIDAHVNLEVPVPKMVLHTYVENAIKHGFKDINSGGILNIKIDALQKGMIILVQDNGKAEAVQTNINENNGKGIKIMESFYRIFEKQHNCKIQTRFKMLHATNLSDTGTEVEIRIQYY